MLPVLRIDLHETFPLQQVDLSDISTRYQCPVVFLKLVHQLFLESIGFVLRLDHEMEEFSEARTYLSKDAATDDLVEFVLDDVALAGGVLYPLHHALVPDPWELLGQNHRQFNEPNISEASPKIEFSQNLQLNRRRYR